MTKLWIPGKPVPKERPRCTCPGKQKPLVFTPKRTYAYERHVATTWAEGSLGAGPIDCPFAAHVEMNSEGAWVTITPLPERTFKLRGDSDNYVKSLIDGLQGVAFTDDINMVELTAKKW